jgi:hypothetical protein
MITENDLLRKYESEPKFKVGFTLLAGDANVYDFLAWDMNIKWKDNPLIPIPSGKRKLVVTSIEKEWEPRKGSNICSWSSNIDYSNDPDFEPIWRVSYDEIDLCYELADFLNAYNLLFENLPKF